MANTGFGSVWEKDVQYETVGATKTLDAADSGVEQRCPVDTVITLPATASGGYYRIVCEVAGVDITVDPAALDQLVGNGFTAADDKDAILTAGNIGDCIELVPVTAGYLITKVVGTWTREA